MLKASDDYFCQNQLFLKHSFRNTIRESNGLDQEADERHELLVWIQTGGNGYLDRALRDKKRVPCELCADLW